MWTLYTKRCISRGEYTQLKSVALISFRCLLTCTPRPLLVRTVGQDPAFHEFLFSPSLPTQNAPHLPPCLLLSPPFIALCRYPYPPSQTRSLPVALRPHVTLSIALVTSAVANMVIAHAPRHVEAIRCALVLAGMTYGLTVRVQHASFACIRPGFPPLSCRHQPLTLAYLVSKNYFPN